MKNISVLIEGTATKRFRPKKPFVTYGTRLAAKEATVFWNFKNITSTIGNNTYGIKGSADKTINEGYYDFQPRYLFQFRQAFLLFVLPVAFLPLQAPQVLSR